MIWIPSEARRRLFGGYGKAPSVAAWEIVSYFTQSDDGGRVQWRFYLLSDGRLGYGNTAFSVGVISTREEDIDFLAALVVGAHRNGVSLLKEVKQGLRSLALDTPGDPDLG
jgi:hypothetical protein